MPVVTVHRTLKLIGVYIMSDDFFGDVESAVCGTPPTPRPYVAEHKTQVVPPCPKKKVKTRTRPCKVLKPIRLFDEEEECDEEHDVVGDLDFVVATALDYFYQRRRTPTPTTPTSATPSLSMFLSSWRSGTPHNTLVCTSPAHEQHKKDMEELQRKAETMNWLS